MSEVQGGTAHLFPQPFPDRHDPDLCTLEGLLLLFIVGEDETFLDGDGVLQQFPPVFREIHGKQGKARIQEVYLLGVHDPLPRGIAEFVVGGQ